MGLKRTHRETIKLSGEWKIRVDGLDGQEETVLRANLPGTLDENRVGVPHSAISAQHLNREFTYEGSAYYETTVNIPKHWAGKQLSLLMERSRETELYVDGYLVGKQSSLVTAQVYDISKEALPGIRTITIKVDNAAGVMSWPQIRNSHIASEETQTNWNGILGRIVLEAKDAVWIEDIQVFPNDGKRKAVVMVQVNKATQGQASCTILLRCENSEGSISESLSFHLGDQVRDTKQWMTLSLGSDMKLWDEHQPFLYRLHAEMKAESPSGDYYDEREVSFGIRRFEASSKGFLMNGKKIFLRGKHDGAVFPLTGYAPMEVAEWRRIFAIAKSYGINHYRFHSWCPPEAAFQAADEIGILLQPELPLWDPGHALEDDEQWQYYREEAFRMLRAYGNHPSFVMFAWGNELGGSLERMEQLCEECRRTDARRLYAIGSNNFFAQARVPRNSDYWTTFWTEGKWNFRTPGYGGMHVRGATPHHIRGHINNLPPSTMQDYRHATRHVPIPVIGHEVGQFQVHPDFQELEKYQGVLKPNNLEAFRKRLEENGLLHKAKLFQRASGQLAVLCYREEIEAALRTPNFGGFQLLDLQDFPGQGTALIGILDAFMESKGLIEPEQWREFCCETVPLLRMKKFIWTNDETFKASVQIAHYGTFDLSESVLAWSVQVEANGFVIANGRMPIRTIEEGGVLDLGGLETDLLAVKDAVKLVVKLEIVDTDYRNIYPLWVYPDSGTPVIPFAVVVCRHLDETTKAMLLSGSKVLLALDPERVSGGGAMSFIPDFWCYSMFKKYGPPGTLSIYCDPEHPALKHFPSEFHTNWQWWNLIKNAKTMNLDVLPNAVEPIVGVVDNVHRQFKLGLLFEAKLGEGKLLVCSMELLKQLDRPEAKQLFISLLTYMDSEAFAPTVEITNEILEKFIQSNEGKGHDLVALQQNADQYG
ncbi:hypothetical protein QFZ80_004895 [Paenibacillus sp. V4I7]|nr:hypothetical protein [Paenibacillus sp. V4I7]